MTTPLIDIRPDHWVIVRDILRKHVPQCDVWAFGSRAKWSAKEYSDLDLAVITDKPLGLSVSAALADDFSESDLPFKVDVVDWATTSESFRKIIERDKVVVRRALKQVIEGLAGEWREMSFSQAVTVNPRVPLKRGVTYPFVDMGAVNASSRCAYAREKRSFGGGGSRFTGGDTLMARITPCLENGKIARFCANPDVVAHGSTEFIVIRGREGISDTAYAYYLTKWDGVSGYAISQMTGTSGRQRVPTSALDQLNITVPSLPEQRAIAHILGTLDDKIELNRRMNETLEAMARALFKSWFVDFDPVRAKTEGRDTGLPKPLADLFPDSFESSELGEIPKGWGVKTVEEIATRVGMGPFGSSIKVESFVQEGIPVISGQHLRGFMVEDTTFNFITEEHAKRLRAANVQRGDVVFTHAGNIGQVAYIPEHSRYDSYVISQRQFFLRCDLAQVNPSFVAFYFRSPEGRHRLLANASSSGVPSIARPVTYLRSIPLTIPPKPIMDAFEKLVRPLLTRFRSNLDEGSTLTALRDSLLPKLISGELRVKGAAGFIEEVIP